MSNHEATNFALKHITVRVPATSANLGPGFDCLGLALDLWNEFELQISATIIETSVETMGEGAGTLPTDGRHLVAQTFASEYQRITGTPANAHRLICRNAVPAGSGLGSSSTAVLGGLLLAHVLAGEPDAGLFDPHGALLKRAIDLEGHGDNVAPALLGGLMIVSTQPASAPDPMECAITQRVGIPDMKLVVCVPDFHFLTTTARAAVPTTLSRTDAIFNIGRALLVLHAMHTGDYELLGASLDDRIHQPYRLPAIPGARDVRLAALDAGASAVALSGAGPGLIAFAQSKHSAIGESMVQVFAAHGLHARYWVLNAQATGATVTCA